jgi:hypothetical protein
MKLVKGGIYLVIHVPYYPAFVEHHKDNEYIYHKPNGIFDWIDSNNVIMNSTYVMLIDFKPELLLEFEAPHIVYTELNWVQPHVVCLWNNRLVAIAPGALRAINH